MALRDSDSDESIDQLEQFQNANVRPGMFVSGWEDPDDEIAEEQNPRGNFINGIEMTIVDCQSTFQAMN